MKRAVLALVFVALILTASGARSREHPSESTGIFGFSDFAQETNVEKTFLAVPDARLAEEHLRILTMAPHIAGSPEDRKTAEYVARKYREAGLDTEIVEYKVWFNYPVEIRVETTAPGGVKVTGPSREHVDDDAFQDDPRVVMPYSGLSPSGDVEADVVYANYGRPEDFRKLRDLKIDVRGKIVIIRYGQNFRGVKSFVAQENGAAGVILYSDPMDDGYFKGDPYPKGQWRPESGVQRGSIGYMFQYPGDPTTPGIASTPDLPESRRIKPEQAAALPAIPTTPLSWGDAQPMLENLGGPESPRDWQGALPFTYHLGPGPVHVKMHLKQEYQYRTIWDVVGKVRGSELPEQWVVSGNHRDAWVYGAVDPNSGTAAQLEAVHGIGVLLKSGWKPRRTLLFCSWDAEEEGLMGSTEWAEQHASDLANAVAYLNMDVAVAGPNFGASSVPSLKQFLRDIAKAVPSPRGGTVYDNWRRSPDERRAPQPEAGAGATRSPNAPVRSDAQVGDLGSGSDYTVFLQHLGVPSTDVGSGGAYGVYHSVFDNFQWFKKFGDPTFAYEQQMARVYGLEAIRMADSDILPFNYEEYGREISTYLAVAEKKAATRFAKAPSFTAADEAAERLTKAGAEMLARQRAGQHPAALNRALLAAEHDLLLADGLPNRPWFRHAIYAPGEYTGYAAVVIPGVNEAIDSGDLLRTEKQLAALTTALERAAKTLEGGL